MEKITSENYVEAAMSTKAFEYDKIASRVNTELEIDLLHAGLGLVTEAGEFVDALKKYIFYGKQVDRVNLAEELGDVMWYIAVATNALGYDLNDIMQVNIEKLAKRYPEKFTEHSAMVRDLDSERQILDKIDTNQLDLFDKRLEQEPSINHQITKDE